MATTANTSWFLIAIIVIYYRGERLTALVDSVASDNIITPQRVSKGIPIDPAHAGLAKRRSVVKVEGKCTLYFDIQDIKCTAEFLVVNLRQTIRDA